MTSAQLIIQSLESYGVEYIFGIPGEENLLLLDAIRVSNIKFIPTRHEQAAAFMAATVGRLTGIPGVVLSTLGPGATNLVTGLAFAQHGGMPLIAITAQKQLRNGNQGMFQLLDVIDLLKPVTKWGKRIEHASSVATDILNAFKIAKSERPGVVHLELPEDIAYESANNAEVLNYVDVRRPTADHKVLSELAKQISKAKYPLIMIASGANRNRISENLTKFINKHEVYFFTTQMGKGVVDERSEFYLGCADTTDSEHIKKAISHSDLVISIGHDIYEKPPSLFTDKHKTIIHIHNYPAQLANVYLPMLEVIGDIANTIEFLNESNLNVYEDDSYFVELAKWNSLNTLNGTIGGSSDIHIFTKALRSSIDDQAIITLDNGLYKLEIAKHFNAYFPNSVILDNALATMGAGLPSAIATKLLYPEKQVVAVVGDGGFMMNAQELETAVRLGLSIIVIVLNDGAYGMIERKQKSHNLEKFGVSFSNPDFVKYAESFGCTGVRASSPGSVGQLIVDASHNKGITLIDCPISY